MNNHLNSFYAMEEMRRKAREKEAEKFRKANEKLNNSFYRHSNPTPQNNFSWTTDETSFQKAAQHLSEVHDMTYHNIMQDYEEPRRSSSSSSCSTSSGYSSSSSSSGSSSNDSSDSSCSSDSSSSSCD